MSTCTRLSRFHRRALCTGEDLNTVCRLRLPVSLPLIPTAANATQRAFESLFLLTWAGVTTKTAPSFIRAVHSTADIVTIRLLDSSHVLPLLSQIPLDRVYVHRDYLELRLQGAQNETLARVRLAVAGRGQARALLDSTTHSRKPQHRINIPEPVAAALSAILRRILLWRTASQIRIGHTDNTVEVEWVGGPSAAVLGAILRNSCCEIPKIAVDVAGTGRIHNIVLSFPVAPSSTSAGEPWWAWQGVVDARVASARLMVAPRLADQAIPPAVWEYREMRNALAARDVSTVYKLLRRYGWSQCQIAEMTDQSQSEVSDILKGRQVMAYDVLVRIADGLGVTRGYMGIAYDEDIAARNAATRNFSEEMTETEAQRRSSLAYSAAITSGNAPAVVYVSWLEIRRVAVATYGLCRLSRQYGPGFVVKAAEEQASWARDLAQAARGGRHRAKLRDLIADLDELAAGQLPASWPDKESM